VKERIVIEESASQLSESTAELIADSSEQAIHARGFFSIALSGGSTPKGLFELLASPEWRNRIDWRKTQVVWGDDRYVPHTDPRSNYLMAKRLLLDHVDVSANNIHAIPTDIPPDEAAQQYEKTLREVLHDPSPFPAIDFNLLGMGENGHTASLFPHRPTLHESKRLVVSDFIPEVDMYRVTMTVPMINAGRKVTFLIAGQSKAAVLCDVISGPRNSGQLPAQLIRAEHGELIWLLDTAAAANLPDNLRSSELQ
jgi:6-phosphogluconolactonase